MIDDLNTLIEAVENDPPPKLIEHECFDHLDKARRIGRANYACPICGKDVSLAWFFFQQAVADDE